MVSIDGGQNENPWKEREMGKETAARKAQEEREEIRQFAEQLRPKVYAKGHADWGTLVSEIEELGVQIGDAVRREFVQQAVGQQACVEAESGREHRRPTCDGPLGPRDRDPRTLLTRRGEIAWQEPQAFCAKSRKAFFPSVEEYGHSRGWQL
jgi:hypothetical protein